MKYHACLLSFLTLKHISCLPIFYSNIRAHITRDILIHTRLLVICVEVMKLFLYVRKLPQLPWVKLAHISNTWEITL